MKKNILKKLLFTLAVIITTGMTVVAADTLPVIVAGTQLTDETSTMNLGDGVLKYDKDNKELILENVTITSSTDYGINLISTTDEVKINLKGNNKIVVTGINFGIRSSKDIIITGDGKLTITAEFPAIQGKKVTLDGAKLDLTTSGQDLPAIECDNTLTIKNNSKIKAKGHGAALSSFGKMEVIDSELELEATRNSSNAIYVEPTNGDGSLTITNSTIKAKSGYACVYSAGKMTLSKSKFNLESIAGGIYSDTSVSIGNSNVLVTEGNYGVGVGQGNIEIEDSTFEMSVNGAAFTINPSTNNLSNKVIYAGYEKDGSDAEILDTTNDFDLSDYHYVRIVDRYNINIVVDENVIIDVDNQLSVIAGENKELTIKAKDGYKIKSVLLNGNEVSLQDNKLSLTNINGDITIKVTSEKIISEINNPKTSDNIINDKLTSIIKVITNLSSVIFIIVIATIAIIFIRNKRIKLLLASNLIGITIINNLLKVIVARDRPNINRLVNENGYSFPSGHSITSMVFYGYLIYLIYRYVDNKNIKVSLIIFLSLLILMIGFSRIYLGVHYTSDVMGGFLLGVVYLIVFISSTKKYLDNRM